MLLTNTSLHKFISLQETQVTLQICTMSNFGIGELRFIQSLFFQIFISPYRHSTTSTSETNHSNLKLRNTADLFSTWIDSSLALNVFLQSCNYLYSDGLLSTSSSGQIKALYILLHLYAAHGIRNAAQLSIIPSLLDLQDTYPLFHGRMIPEVSRYQRHPSTS